MFTIMILIPSNYSKLKDLENNVPSLHVALNTSITCYSIKATIGRNLELCGCSFMDPWVEDIHFPQVSIPVTLKREEIVTPNGPVPVISGDTHYLSNLDDMIGSRVFTPTVYFYSSDSSTVGSQTTVVGRLQDALASVLVLYYPFSGRLRETDKGKLQVFFGPGQGALIVEAESSIALADLGDLTVPNPAWSPLIYRFPNEEPYKVVDMPLVIAQVTHFRCGGFSLGLRLCHCLCDGLGAMQFVSAWAATAKAGTVVASPNPCWGREYFYPHNPPSVNYPHTEFMSIEDGSTLTRSLWEVKPVQKCYKISKRFQDRLKALAQQENKDIKCSSFDAMAAHVWRSWVKALKIEPVDFELRLTFSVNTRQMLKNPPLRDGFYGNAVCIACATSTVLDLTDKPLSHATRLVHEARLSVCEDYLRSTVDYIELKRPNRLEFGGKLTITQWTRFSLYDSGDFGWGRPSYAGPIDLTPTPQVCVFLPQEEANSNGRMVVCICLPEAATSRFRDFFCLMKEDCQ